MFITDDDYKVVIDPNALKILSQGSEANIRNAEAEAIEEISSYLRPGYDCQAIFYSEGSARNRYLVMITIDIVLYHLAASISQRNGMEIRKERYDRAIKWLEGVQEGKIIPDLPPLEDSSGAAAFGTTYHSERKLHHDW